MVERLFWIFHFNFAVSRERREIAAEASSEISFENYIYTSNCSIFRYSDFKSVRRFWSQFDRAKLMDMNERWRWKKYRVEKIYHWTSQHDTPYAIFPPPSSSRVVRAKIIIWFNEIVYSPPSLAFSAQFFILLSPFECETIPHHRHHRRLLVMWNF